MTGDFLSSKIENTFQHRFYPKEVNHFTHREKFGQGVSHVIPHFSTPPSRGDEAVLVDARFYKDRSAVHPRK